MQTNTMTLRLAAVVALVAATFTPGAATAQQEPPAAEVTTADLAALGINDAELQDLTRIAKQYGITLDEAIADYSWQDDFSASVKTISEKYPDQFAGAAIEDNSAWIGFKADVPADVSDAFARSQVPVSFVPSRGFSERELVDAVTTAHYDVSSRVAAGTPIASSYDIRTGKITVEVNGLAVEADQLEAAVNSVDVGQVVDVVGTTVTMGDDTMYGGGKLATCTAGFSVRSAGGVGGLVTAGHCGDSQYYEGRVTTFRGEHVGANGDWQWHSSAAEDEADDFYYDFGVRRDVAAQGNPVVGQTLCRFGQTTGARCDQVRANGSCRGTICKLTLMENRYADGGDSGGPWYYGNSAYGVHSGWVLAAFKNRDQFTPLLYSGDALNVYLRST